MNKRCDGEMRLICGAIRLDGANAPEEMVRAMAAQMDVPRLAPGLSLWRDGPIAMAVLDFSRHGTPGPELPAQNGTTIAADVRLDDRDALRQSLGADISTTDDGLLLSALEKLGPSGLDRVPGDFAFAAWNRETQRLTCGRDAFGIRPFAYAYRPGEFFAFASLPKAIHGSGVVPKIVDEDTLLRRATLIYRFDDSLIAGIRRLPPAHFLEVSRDGISLNRYWQLDRAGAGTRRCSPEEAARELRHLVDDAVRCRIPDRGEVGAHLSGGLDSSAIAILAARALRGGERKLHAWSFIDRKPDGCAMEDETDFVQSVLRQEGDIDWTPIPPPESPVIGAGPLDADKMAPIGEDIPDIAVCARAERQGIGVILSGWGGDQGATFNGIGALVELFRRGRWRTAARGITALAREQKIGRARLLYRHVICWLLPEFLVRTVGRVRGRSQGVTEEFRGILSPAARERLAGAQRAYPGMAPDGRENRWRLLTDPHRAERTELWAQVGALHGIAFAFPLLDRRVAEFALSLPSEMFVREGFRRAIFREAMSGVLPERVRLRHTKYAPFPNAYLDIGARKSELLAQLDVYERNETVRRLIDLPEARRRVEALPSPDVLRGWLERGGRVRGYADLIGLLRALWVAEYLCQHATEQPARSAAGGGL